VTTDHIADTNCYRRGCRREECRAADRLARKMRIVRNERGIPAFIPGRVVAAHLHKLIDSGLTRLDIAAQSGVADRTIRRILTVGDTQVQRPKAAALFAVKPLDRGGRVDTTATVRRIQGLAALGWPIGWTAREVGHGPQYLFAILNGSGTTLQAATEQRVAEVAGKYGTRQGPSKSVRGCARRNGWAPLAAWDDDTIDDPDAQPDWTGHCGSDRGYWMHKRQQLPMCPRCEQAHEAWLEERADLSTQELNRERFKARAAASQREADLAIDARELMRLGADYEQAAERLGVTRNHLQQALKRHPELKGAAA